MLDYFNKNVFYYSITSKHPHISTLEKVLWCASLVYPKQDCLTLEKVDS